MFRARSRVNTPPPVAPSIMMPDGGGAGQCPTRAHTPRRRRAGTGRRGRSSDAGRSMTVFATIVDAYIFENEGDMASAAQSADIAAARK